MTEPLLPPFNFAPAFSLTVGERLDKMSASFRHDAQNWEPRFAGDVRPIPPDGAGEAELRKLEAGNEAALPKEYRQFLLRARYYCPFDGFWIHGVSQLNEDNVDDCRAPWLSDKHWAGRQCWVIGEYWRYADGDQLLIFVDDPGAKVVLYLHEQGPQFETFAPSFSLALWRMAYEVHDDGDDE